MFMENAAPDTLGDPGSEIILIVQVSICHLGQRALMNSKIQVGTRP
jgi:hypothetical protein